MASTVIKNTIDEALAPALAFLVAIDGSGTPEPAGYTLTADASNGFEYNFIVAEALTNLFRIEFQNGDGVTVAIRYVEITADDTGPYYSEESKADALASRVLQEVYNDTNEMQADLENGGRLDIIFDAILADTNEVQLSLANGGFTDLLIDSLHTKIDTLTTAVATIDTVVDGIATDVATGFQVTIMPGFFNQQVRNVTSNISLYTGETGTYSLVLLDGDRELLDTSGMTLELRFCANNGTSITTIADGDLGHATAGLLTFDVPALLTASAISNGSYTLRDTANGDNVVVIGKLTVTQAC